MEAIHEAMENLNKHITVLERKNARKLSQKRAGYSRKRLFPRYNQVTLLREGHTDDPKKEMTTTDDDSDFLDQSTPRDHIVKTVSKENRSTASVISGKRLEILSQGGKSIKAKDGAKSQPSELNDPTESVDSQKRYEKDDLRLDLHQSGEHGNDLDATTDDSSERTYRAPQPSQPLDSAKSLTSSGIVGEEISSRQDTERGAGVTGETRSVDNSKTTSKLLNPTDDSKEVELPVESDLENIRSPRSTKDEKSVVEKESNKDSFHDMPTNKVKDNTKPPATRSSDKDEQKGSGKTNPKELQMNFQEKSGQGPSLQNVSPRKKLIKSTDKIVEEVANITMVPSPQSLKFRGGSLVSTNPELMTSKEMMILATQDSHADDLTLSKGSMKGGRARRGVTIVTPIVEEEAEPDVVTTADEDDKKTDISLKKLTKKEKMALMIKRNTALRSRVSRPSDVKTRTFWNKLKDTTSHSEDESVSLKYKDDSETEKVETDIPYSDLSDLDVSNENITSKVTIVDTEVDVTSSETEAVKAENGVESSESNGNGPSKKNMKGKSSDAKRKSRKSKSRQSRSRNGRGSVVSQVTMNSITEHDEMSGSPGADQSPNELDSAGNHDTDNGIVRDDLVQSSMATEVNVENVDVDSGNNKDSSVGIDKKVLKSESIDVVETAETQRKEESPVVVTTETNGLDSASVNGSFDKTKTDNRNITPEEIQQVAESNKEVLSTRDENVELDPSMNAPDITTEDSQEHVRTDDADQNNTINEGNKSIITPNGDTQQDSTADRSHVEEEDGEKDPKKIDIDTKSEKNPKINIGVKPDSLPNGDKRKSTNAPVTKSIVGVRKTQPQPLRTGSRLTGPSASNKAKVDESRAKSRAKRDTPTRSSIVVRRPSQPNRSTSRSNVPSRTQKVSSDDSPAHSGSNTPGKLVTGKQVTSTARASKVEKIAKDTSKLSTEDNSQIKTVSGDTIPVEEAVLEYNKDSQKQTGDSDNVKEADGIGNNDVLDHTHSIEPERKDTYSDQIMEETNMLDQTVAGHADTEPTGVIDEGSDVTKRETIITEGGSTAEGGTDVNHAKDGSTVIQDKPIGDGTEQIEGEKNGLGHTTHSENKLHEQSDTMLNENIVTKSEIVAQTHNSLANGQVDEKSTLVKGTTSGSIDHETKRKDSVASKDIIIEQNGMHWIYGSSQNEQSSVVDKYVASFGNDSVSLAGTDVINNAENKPADEIDLLLVDDRQKQYPGSVTEQRIETSHVPAANDINKDPVMKQNGSHGHHIHGKQHNVKKRPSVVESIDTSLQFKKPMKDFTPVQAKEPTAPILSTSAKDVKDKSKLVTRFLVTDSTDDYKDIETITSTVEATSKPGASDVVEIDPSAPGDVVPSADYDMTLEEAEQHSDHRKRKVHLVVPEPEPELQTRHKPHKISSSLDKDASKPSVIQAKVKKSHKHDVSAAKLIYKPQFSLQMREHSKTGPTWATRPAYQRTKSEKEMAVRRSKSEGVVLNKTKATPRVKSASIGLKAYTQRLTRKKSTHTTQPLMHAFGTPRQEKLTSVTPRLQGQRTPSLTPRQKTQTSLRSRSQITATPASILRQKTQSSITSTIPPSETPTHAHREMTQLSVTSVKQLTETPTSTPRQITQTSILSEKQAVKTPSDIPPDKIDTPLKPPVSTSNQTAQMPLTSQSQHNETPRYITREQAQLSIKLKTQVSEKPTDAVYDKAETTNDIKQPDDQSLKVTPLRSETKVPAIKHKPKLPRYLEDKAAKQRLVKPQTTLSPRVRDKAKEAAASKNILSEDQKQSDTGKKRKEQNSYDHLKKDDTETESRLAEVKAEQTYMVLSKPGFQAPPTIKLYQKLQNIKQKDTLPQKTKTKDESTRTGMPGYTDVSKTKRKQMSETKQPPKRRESIRKPLYLDKFYSPAKSPTQSVGKESSALGTPRLEERSYSFTTAASRSRSRSQSESPGRNRISPRNNATAGPSRYKYSTRKNKSQTPAGIDLDHILKLETENTDEFFDRLDQINEETMKYEMDKVKQEELRSIHTAEQETEGYFTSEDKEASDDRGSRRSRYDDFAETKKDLHDDHRKEKSKTTNFDIYKNNDLVGAQENSNDDLIKVAGSKEIAPDADTTTAPTTAEIIGKSEADFHETKEQIEDEEVGPFEVINVSVRDGVADGGEDQERSYKNVKSDLADTTDDGKLPKTSTKASTDLDKQLIRTPVSDLNVAKSLSVTVLDKDMSDNVIKYDSETTTGIIEKDKEGSKSPEVTVQPDEVLADIPATREADVFHEQKSLVEDGAAVSSVELGVEESTNADMKVDVATAATTDEITLPEDKHITGDVDLAKVPGSERPLSAVISTRLPIAGGTTETPETSESHVKDLEIQVAGEGKASPSVSAGIQQTAEQNSESTDIIVQNAPLGTEMDHVKEKIAAEVIEDGRSVDVDLQADTNVQPELDDKIEITAEAIDEIDVKGTVERIEETVDTTAVKDAHEPYSVEIKESEIEERLSSTHAIDEQTQERADKAVTDEHLKAITSDERNLEEITDLDAVDPLAERNIDEQVGPTNIIETTTTVITTAAIDGPKEATKDDAKVTLTDSEPQETSDKTGVSKASKTTKAKTKGRKKKLKKKKKGIAAKKGDEIVVADSVDVQSLMMDSMATEESARDISETEDDFDDLSIKVDQADVKSIDQNKEDEKAEELTDIEQLKEKDDEEVLEDEEITKQEEKPVPLVSDACEEVPEVKEELKEKEKDDTTKEEKAKKKHKEEEKDDTPKEEKVKKKHKEEEKDDTLKEEKVKKKHKDKPIHIPRGEARFEKSDGRETRRWGRTEFFEVVQTAMLADKGSDEETFAEEQDKGDDKQTHSKHQHHRRRQSQILTADSTFIEDDHKSTSLYSVERSTDNWSKIRGLDYYSIKAMYKDKPVTRSKSSDRDGTIVLQEEERKHRKSRRDSRHSGIRKRELTTNELDKDQEMANAEISETELLLDQVGRRLHKSSRHSRREQTISKEKGLGNLEQNQELKDQIYERKHRKSRHSRTSYSDVRTEGMAMSDSKTFVHEADDEIKEDKTEHEDKHRESRRKRRGEKKEAESQEGKPEIQPETIIPTVEQNDGNDINMNETLDANKQDRRHKRSRHSRTERRNASRGIVIDSSDDSDQQGTDGPLSDRQTDRRQRRHSQNERLRASRERMSDVQTGDEKDTMGSMSSDMQHVGKHRSRHSRRAESIGSRDVNIDLQNVDELEQMDVLLLDRRHDSRHTSRRSRGVESIASREMTIDLYDVDEHEKTVDVPAGQKLETRHRSRHHRRAESIVSSDLTVDEKEHMNMLVDRKHERRHRSRQSTREKNSVSVHNEDKVDMSEDEVADKHQIRKQRKSKHSGRESLRDEINMNREKTFDSIKSEENVDNTEIDKHKIKKQRKSTHSDRDTLRHEINMNREKTFDSINADENVDNTETDKHKSSKHRKSRHSNRDSLRHEINMNREKTFDSINGEENGECATTDKQESRQRKSRHSERDSLRKEINMNREKTFDSINGEENGECATTDKQEKRQRTSRHSERDPLRKEINMNREKTFDSLNEDQMIEDASTDKHRERKHRHSRHSRREQNSADKEKTLDSLAAEENINDAPTDKQQERRKARESGDYSVRESMNLNREKTFDSLNVDDIEAATALDLHHERRLRGSRHSRREHRSGRLEYTPEFKEGTISLDKSDVDYSTRHRMSRHSRTGHSHPSRELTSGEILENQIFGISDDNMDYIGEREHSRRHSRRSRLSRREHSNVSLEWSIISETGDGEIAEGNDENANDQENENGPTKSNEQGNVTTEILPVSKSTDIKIKKAEHTDEISVVNMSDKENTSMVGKSGNLTQDYSDVNMQLESDALELEDYSDVKATGKLSKKKTKKAKRSKRDASKSGKSTKVKKENRKH